MTKRAPPTEVQIDCRGSSNTERRAEINELKNRTKQQQNLIHRSAHEAGAQESKINIHKGN